MFFDIDEDFTWGGLWREIRYGAWSCGWDDRKPLPGGWLGGVTYMWYDGPNYAARLWRFYVCNWRPTTSGSET